VRWVGVRSARSLSEAVQKELVHTSKEVARRGSVATDKRGVNRTTISLGWVAQRHQQTRLLNLPSIPRHLPQLQGGAVRPRSQQSRVPTPSLRESHLVTRVRKVGVLRYGCVPQVPTPSRAVGNAVLDCKNLQALTLHSLCLGPLCENQYRTE
jgi:hypothetical protein